jgi:hypothetical protein
MRDMKDVLERMQPAPEANGDWEAVLRDAAVSRRGLVLRPLVGVAVAAAAVFGLALFQPWTGESPTVLERALAAVDEGPVLHVVLRDEAEGAVIDLETGDRSPLYREREVWFDEARGLREVTRFGGVVQRDVFYAPDRLSSDLLKTYSGLASGYREALKNGDARVLGQGDIDGVPVHWIQTERYVLFDPDGTRHVWQRVVAVSQETFEPVYVDEKADGEFGPQTGARIRSVEWLPAEKGDFRVHGANRPFGGFVIRNGRKAPDELTALLGRTPLWLGETFQGIPLEASGSAGRSAAPEVSMFYGSRFSHGRERGAPDLRRFVVLKQTPDLAVFPEYVAEFFRPGLVVVLERQGFVQKNGLYVVIAARTEELILAAARGLKPMPR